MFKLKSQSVREINIQLPWKFIKKIIVQAYCSLDLSVSSFASGRADEKSWKVGHAGRGIRTHDDSQSLVYGIYVWVNYNDLTVLPHWKSWFIWGKSSPNGRKIQVSEIL